MKRIVTFLVFLLLCNTLPLLAQTDVKYEYATLMLSHKYDKPSTAVLFTTEGEKVYSCPVIAPTSKAEEENITKYTGSIEAYVQTQRLNYYMNELANEGWEYYECLDAGSAYILVYRYIFRRVINWLLNIVMSDHNSPQNTPFSTSE